MVGSGAHVARAGANGGGTQHNEQCKTSEARDHKRPQLEQMNVDLLENTLGVRELRIHFDRMVAGLGHLLTMDMEAW